MNEHDVFSWSMSPSFIKVTASQRQGTLRGGAIYAMDVSSRECLTIEDPGPCQKQTWTPLDVKLGFQFCNRSMMVVLPGPP